MSDRDELREYLLSFCEEVAFHLRDKGLRGRNVTLKARFSDFRTVTRSKTLDFATNLGPRLYAVTRELLDKVEARPLRLLGVQVARLEDVRQPAQPTLFPIGHEPSSRADFLRTSEKLARATESLDKLRRRFGRDVVVPAALLGRARALRADGLESANAEGEPPAFD